jgi:hypothetical protein
MRHGSLKYRLFAAGFQIRIETPLFFSGMADSVVPSCPVDGIASFVAAG